MPCALSPVLPFSRAPLLPNLSSPPNTGHSVSKTRLSVFTHTGPPHTKAALWRGSWSLSLPGSKGEVMSVTSSPTPHTPHYTGLFLHLVSWQRAGQGVLRAVTLGLSSTCLCHFGSIQTGVQSGHKCVGGRLSGTDPGAAGSSTVVHGHAARALSLPCVSSRDVSLQGGVQISGSGLTSAPAVSVLRGLHPGLESPDTTGLRLSSPSLKFLQPWQR